MILSLFVPLLSFAGAIASAMPPATQGASAELPDNPASIPAEFEEVAIDRDRYERMTVPVTIAGRGPYRFMVDTGSQATAITQRVVDDLALRPDGEAMLVAMGSQALVATVPLDRLEFANRSLDGIRAPLLLSRHVGADGILGLDALQSLRVLMDFEGDRIVVADAGELGGRNGFEIVVRARRKLGQMIITDARINGMRVNVLIDTGAQRSFGNEELRRRLIDRNVGSEIATDVHGVEVRNELRQARRIVIGGLSLSGVSVGFANSPIFEALGLTDKPALVLGMDDLRAFRRVAIDFEDRRILFDLPREVAVERLRRMTPFRTGIDSRID
ncbi:aspartyl protease family protein [Qipengyuania sp. MTN3-11]|uniref:aspartyl protease family protein n=1 Tax=Qipengyuania sp. MTN3-11 TaxID=3056557 RepID=UPI0036F3C8B9